MCTHRRWVEASSLPASTRPPTPRPPRANQQAWCRAALRVAADAPALLRRGRAFLLPHISELVLAEARDLEAQLPDLLGALQPHAAPALRALVVSAPLGRQAAPALWLAGLPLPLQRLELVDAPLPGGSLESISHLRHLTELSVSLTAVAAGSATMVEGVACLSCLRGLQVRGAGGWEGSGAGKHSAQRRACVL